MNERMIDWDGEALCFMEGTKCVASLVCDRFAHPKLERDWLNEKLSWNAISIAVCNSDEYERDN